MGANGDAHVRRAIEFLLAYVLALEGESPEAIRDGCILRLPTAGKFIGRRR